MSIGLSINCTTTVSIMRGFDRLSFGKVSRIGVVGPIKHRVILKGPKTMSAIQKYLLYVKSNFFYSK